MSGPWEAYSAAPTVPVSDGPWGKYKRDDSVVPPVLPIQPPSDGGTGNGGSPTDKPRQSLPDALAGDIQQLRQGATFGFGDELSAAAATPLNMAVSAIRGKPVGSMGENYDKLLASDRGISKQFEQEHPAISLGLNLAGGAGAGSGIVNGSEKVLGAVPLAGKYLAGSNIAKGALTGGIYGGAFGLGNGEGGIDNRLESAKTGAGYGALTGGIAGPIVDKTLGAFSRGVAGTAPLAGKTTQALQSTKNKLYDAAEQSGTYYDASGLKNLATAVETDLQRSGYSPSDHTYTANLLKRMENGENLTLPGVDALRQSAYQGPGGADSAFAKRIGKQIDNFMLDDTNLAAGSTDTGIALNRQARDANSAFKASEVADQIEEAVRTRARGTTAPTAATNKIRQIQADDDAMKFLTADQQAALDKAAETGRFQRGIMQVGKLAPNRLLGANLAGASALTGLGTPFAIGGAALGTAAQVADKAITNSNVKNVLGQLRFNGQEQPNAFARAGQSLAGSNNPVAKATRSVFGLNAPTVGTNSGLASPIQNTSGLVGSGAASAAPAIQPQPGTITRSPGVRLNARPEATAAAAALTLPAVVGTGMLAQSASQSPKGPQIPGMAPPPPNNDHVQNPQDFNHDDFLDTLTNGVESNGEKNAKNPKSSALGPYQMIRSTFAGLVKKYDPETYQKGDFQALRSDPEYSRFIAQKYSQENVQKLVSEGLPVNKTTAYLAWFADGKTAAKLLKSPASAPADSVFSSAALEANPFLKGKTVAQVVQWAQKKVNRA